MAAAAESGSSKRRFVSQCGQKPADISPQLVFALYNCLSSTHF
jgi:hypothetical protein